ncbi:MAG: cyclic nucleotide-binding domain-containing protein [Chloroflexota bacterium]|nr:MAG: cyclic nucleotide-binding domain-containing protein [Chloroflexota bacterium]
MFFCTEDEKISILMNTRIFSEVPVDHLGDIASRLKSVYLKPGENLFEEGEEGSVMYIVYQGLVQVHVGEREFNCLGPGEAFGEMAAIDHQVRSASVTAVEETSLLSLERSDLYDVMEKDPNIVKAIIHVLSENVRTGLKDMTRDFLYIQQVHQITSVARAIEMGDYEAGSLDEVAQREDELGQLARVFQDMVREVYAREKRLKQQVQELRIELDESRQQEQVEEITGTEYFQRLRKEAGDLRKIVGDMDSAVDKF